MVAVVEGSPGVEVGMVGREGMLGAHVALFLATAPLHALVQGVDSARCIDAWQFAAAGRESLSLCLSMTVGNICCMFTLSSNRAATR